jgi:uncharacterized protein (TIGR03435 family)
MLAELTMGKRRTCSTMLVRLLWAGIFAFKGTNLPLALAQQPAQAGAIDKAPSFEVASIKPSKPDDTNHDWDDYPGRLSIENYTLRQIIQSAYGLKSESQVVGGPKWIDDKHYDITAKTDDAETEKMKNLNREEWIHERSLILQSLLAERFQLKVRLSERSIPVYALIVARSGIKFAPSAATETRHSLSGRNTQLTAAGISMESLANYLTRQPESDNRVILNQTRLTGDYDFKLEWTRDRGNGIPPDAPYPGLLTALEEQLGLKLESQKGSVPVVTIDSAVQPALD